MKRNFIGLSRKYQAALRKHLWHARPKNLRSAQALGRRAMTVGLETLDLARIHEQALINMVLPADSSASRETKVRQAGTFFAEAIIPIEKTHRAAMEANTSLNRLNNSLVQRSLDLAASNRQLKQEIAQRQSAEKSLRISKEHYGRLLNQSRQMQEHLRLLSRQLLSAQEDERKKISRELHDVIAQTLTSINVRLSALKKEAAVNTKGLEHSIASTQELVERSVAIVHRFARELRPTVLDDLGLIPALHTYLKSFKEETGIRVSLTAFAAVEHVNGDKRIVLYRVAQEALTNVARHAKASRTEVKIQKLNGDICMKIIDNGKGFHEGDTFEAKKNMRLGLLGMKERLDMVGGNFTVTSAPGKGTTVQALIPFSNHSKKKGGVQKAF